MMWSMVSSSGTSVKREDTSYETKTSSSSTVRLLRRSAKSVVVLMLYSFSVRGSKQEASNLAVS